MSQTSGYYKILAPTGNKVEVFEQQLIVGRDMSSLARWCQDRLLHREFVIKVAHVFRIQLHTKKRHHTEQDDKTPRYYSDIFKSASKKCPVLAIGLLTYYLLFFNVLRTFIYWFKYSYMLYVYKKAICSRICYQDSVLKK